MFDESKNHCRHYNKGNCKFGNKCRKSHDFTPEKKHEKKHKRHHHKKNTENFEPDNSPPDMRLLVAPSREIVKNDLSERDVIVIPNFLHSAIAVLSRFGSTTIAISGTCVILVRPPRL